MMVACLHIFVIVVLPNKMGENSTKAQFCLLFFFKNGRGGGTFTPCPASYPPARDRIIEHIKFTCAFVLFSPILFGNTTITKLKFLHGSTTNYWPRFLRVCPFFFTHTRTLFSLSGTYTLKIYREKCCVMTSTVVVFSRYDYISK
jgi:multimeric flavodoxin WrbA